MIERAVVNAWLIHVGIPPRELLRKLRDKVKENELVLRASATTYYVWMAFIPFLSVLITLAGNLVPNIAGVSGTRGALGGLTVDEFRETLAELLPKEAYGVVANEISRIQNEPPVGLLLLSLLISLWLASGIFSTVIDALNRIQGVVETRPYWKLTVTAIGLTVLEALIMLGTLVVLVIWPQFRVIPGWAGTLQTLVEWLIVAGGILLSCSMAAYLGPNVERPWKWITPGSTFGTIALLAASFLLRVYVRSFADYGKTYGSLAGVVLLLSWFWIASLILLVALQIDTIIEAERRPT